MNKAANCWPDNEQTLLLKAALITDKDQARSYWDMFCNAVDIQSIDYSTTSMTPMVYKRFRDIQGSEIQVAKSVYRHTWSSNSLSLHSLRKVLLAFTDAGIRATLLKGAAMISSYYNDPGLRVIGDLDILVLEGQREAAMDLLTSMGWHQIYTHNVQQLKYTHATAFRNNDGVNIDLHWRILSDAAFDHSYINFHPKLREAHNFQAYTLCPEDQLLHTLIHCHKYSPVPLIRWIPDASILLNKTKDFNWDYFFEKVKILRVEFVVKNTLLYLSGEKFIDLQDKVLQRVQSLAWTKRDEKYFQFLTKPRSNYLYFYIYIFRLHARNNLNSGFLELAASLPRFVMNSIGVSSIKKLFQYELHRCSRHIYRKINGVEF